VTKFPKRTVAAITAMMFFAILTAYFLPALTVKSAETPLFIIESSTPAAKAGDVITVSLYVDNHTETAISSFDGAIAFNNSHFNYLDFILPANMQNKLTCLDNKAFTESTINLTFADTTKSLIPASTSHLLLLQLRFTVVSPVAGTGQIIFTPNSCFSGSTNYGTVAPAQLHLPVSPTQSTSQSTQSTTSSTKQRSSDARLRSLSVAPGTLTPAFNPEFVAYSVSVEFEIATIRISATPNSTEAVASGVGVKDLAVGQNTFTVTVTAEDGTIMQYGVVVYRAAETQPTQTSSTTSSNPIVIDPSVTASTAPPPTDYPTASVPTASQPDKIIEGGSEAPSDTELIKIIGIIFAEVALFMFGFLAGFFLDKNMRKKTIAEIAYGSLDRPSKRREPPMPAQYPPQMMPEYPDYQPDYAPDYAPDYGTYPEYSEPFQQDYDGFPQYDGSGYSDQRFDEYGNPVLDNAQYGDGFWDYDGGDDPYYH